MDDKYQKALSVDIEWYCVCGKSLNLSDVHCGWFGYEDHSSLTCLDCGQEYSIAIDICVKKNLKSKSPKPDKVIPPLFLGDVT